MSTVDGIELITKCVEEDDCYAFYSEEDRKEFSAPKNSPHARWRHIIPFQWHYCYDCRAQQFIHSSATPI